MKSQEDKIVMKKLKCITIISMIFMFVEILGGYMAHSVAILADAFHLLSDVLAYVISLQAVHFSYKLPPKYLSFGYEKLQPLGALFNILIIYFVTFELLMEATSRIINKEVVQQPLYMLLTSFFGLGCNLYIMKVLHGDQQHGGCSHSHSHSHQHVHQNHQNPKKHQHQHHQYSQETERKYCKNHKGYQPCQSNCYSPKQVNLIDGDLQDQIQNNHDHHEHHEHHNCSHQKQEPSTVEVDVQYSPNQLIEESMEKGKAHLHQNSSHDNLDHLDHHDHHNHHDHHDHHQHGHPHENQGPSIFKNLNIQAAYVHIISDIILSVGVILSALLIYFKADPNQWSYWHLADPFCTYFFSIVAIYSTLSIIKDSIIILLDGSDNKFLIQGVEEKINAIPNINIQDLKIWTSNRNKYYAAIKIQKQKPQKNNQSSSLKKKINEILSFHNIKNTYIDISSNYNDNKDE